MIMRVRSPARRARPARGVEMMVVSPGGPSCRPHACSSARCCGGSWAPGRPSGWRRARPPWCTSAPPTAPTGSARTFTAYDHHYALVVVRGLTPDSATTYEVLVDDERVWPLPGDEFPPSVIRTRVADDRDQPVRLVFGSCREATPQRHRPASSRRTRSTPTRGG